MFEASHMLAPATVTAYLGRLGLDAQPPSAEALRLLAQRHVERVPYETLWIPAGERWSIDPTSAAERIAFEGRGGYCYHLNGALGLLLSALGYRVQGHVGGVQVGAPNPNAMGNHLVLTVSGLPNEENPPGWWYVDAGLGDALHEPLPLAAGTYSQAPFQLALEPAGDHGWRLTHDPAGGFDSMTWTDRLARSSDFVAQHRELSTSPESGFVRVPMAERRDAAGIDVIRGVVLARIGAGAFTGEPILVVPTGSRCWRTSSTSASPRPRDRWREDLWQAVLRRHRAWSESQQ